MFTKEKLEMFEDQYGLHFSFKWMSPAVYFMALFSTLWMAFIIFWYTNALTTGAPLIFLIVPLIHVAIGIAMIYGTLSNFLNKTSIDLIGDELTIKHGPIPWYKGDQKVNINDIKQFYVKEIKIDTQEGVSRNYGVWGILQDGSRLDLTNGVKMDSDYALEVEQKLETYLGIIDQPVKGAFGNNYKPAIEVEETEPTLDLDDLKNQPKPEINRPQDWNDKDFV